MIEIDEIVYNAEWKKESLEQTADILNGDNAGRLQNTGDMFLDPIGTFFNNTAVIRRGKECTDDEWDNLFMVLADPLGEHTVKVPFNQGCLTCQIYMSQIKRTLLNQKYNKNKWSKEFSITFTAMESQWLAGGELQGYTEGV